MSSWLKYLFYTRFARFRKQLKPVTTLSTEHLYLLCLYVYIIICHFYSFVAFSLLCRLLAGWQILVVTGEWRLRWVLPEGWVKLRNTWNHRENLQARPWHRQWLRLPSASCLPTPLQNNWTPMALHISVDCKTKPQAQFELLSREAYIREAERQCFKGKCMFCGTIISVPLRSGSTWAN